MTSKINIWVDILIACLVCYIVYHLVFCFGPFRHYDELCDGFFSQYDLVEGHVELAKQTLKSAHKSVELTEQILNKTQQTYTDADSELKRLVDSKNFLYYGAQKQRVTNSEIALKTAQSNHTNALSDEQLAQSNYDNALVEKEQEIKLRQKIFDNSYDISTQDTEFNELAIDPTDPISEPNKPDFSHGASTAYLKSMLHQVFYTSDNKTRTRERLELGGGLEIHDSLQFNREHNGWVFYNPNTIEVSTQSMKPSLFIAPKVSVMGVSDPVIGEQSKQELQNKWDFTKGIELSADTTVSLTGILIGDVNDSYSGLIA